MRQQRYQNQYVLKQQEEFLEKAREAMKNRPSLFSFFSRKSDEVGQVGQGKAKAETRSANILISAEAKILIVGEQEVGKTSIAKRYCYDVFHEGRDRSHAVSCFTKTQMMDDARTEECQLKIWDTLGQE